MKAIITGAGNGIGKAISIKLNALGYDLILISRGSENLKQTKDQILASNPTGKNSIKLFIADLSTEDWLEQFKKEFVDLTPDVVVNNVGGYEVDLASTMKLEKFLKLLQLNFLSAVALTQFLLPKMVKKQGGVIFNICSVAAIKPKMDAVSYSISKSSLKIWGEALREEVKKDKIKVTNILPGAVATHSWEGSEAATEKMIQVEDIAMAIEYVLSISQGAYCGEIHLNPMSDFQ